MTLGHSGGRNTPVPPTRSREGSLHCVWLEGATGSEKSEEKMVQEKVVRCRSMEFEVVEGEVEEVMQRMLHSYSKNYLARPGMRECIVC